MNITSILKLSVLQRHIFMIAKKLQENRRARRNDKVRLEQIQSIKSTIPILVNKKNLTSFEEKTYTYKSDVMSSISHKPKNIIRCKNKER